MSSASRTTSPSRLGAGSRCAAGGFTLIELLVVFAIVAIIAGIGRPMFLSAIEETNLTATAEEIASAVRYAQAVSMNTGRACRLTIDEEGDSLLVERLEYAGDITKSTADSFQRSDVEVMNYAPAPHPFERGHDYVIRFAEKARFHGVDITVSTFGPGRGIVFDMLGRPSSGGAVTFTAGTRTIALAINSTTGKVSRIE